MAEKVLAEVDYKPTGEFRKFMPTLEQPRFQIMKQQDAHEYAEAFKTEKQPPWLHALYVHWRDLFQEPYKGITTDGTVREGLFKVQDEGVPIEKIVDTTNKFVSILDSKQQDSVLFHVDSPEWRTWSNPEFLLVHKGLRLDEITENVRDHILEILKVSLSPEGYDKAIKAMEINGYLGEIFEVPKVVNRFSYNFAIFGRPSTTRPWGWSFYGHHLCLNVFFYQRQIIISPWFTGAEPNEIDQGPLAGTRILYKEDALGLKLMQSLPAESQQAAQIYKQMHDPAMPPGRWNKDDQRHLCGAYRDNRTIPYEGIKASTFTPEQKSLLYAIGEEYLLYLPAQSRKMKLDHIRSFENETYFCWIGGYTDTDPFYFRIQSPVIIIEFDHHSGVFLNNEQPAKFHIHTLLRTPNAGDYGMAVRKAIPAVEGTVGKEIKWGVKSSL